MKDFKTNKMKKLNMYKCPQCNKILERESVKKWIESYCYETGKNVRLQKITPKK